MKKETNYIQCALMRENSHHMAWIPEKFAIIDKFIKIKNDDDTWTDGWKVVGVGDKVVKTASEANAQSQLYKKTRKASDI
jgi:hypothetical protein